MPESPRVRLEHPDDPHNRSAPVERLTTRAAIVHVLRQLQPGHVVSIPAVERLLPPGSPLWSLTRQRRRAALSANLRRLAFPREGATHRGQGDQDPVSWNPSEYELPGDSRAGDLRAWVEGGGSRGVTPFPRCLDPGTGRGEYVILPEVYEPQTHAERAHGVPEHATADPAPLALDDDAIERLRREVPAVRSWSTPELRIVVDAILRTLRRRPG